MLKCTGEIEESQIQYLHQFKNQPSELDYHKHETLIEIDWTALEYQGDYEDMSAFKGVEMSPQEQVMSSDVEELSEDMRRETDAEARKSLGKTQLAFVDLENMDSVTSTIWILFASVLFGGIGYFFYQKLF